jgi:hypothetical protein
LSSPPNHRSGQRGRSARIIATLIAPMAMMPLYWIIVSRRAKKLVV